MSRNRVYTENTPYRLPQPPAPAIQPSAFMLCPPALFGATPVQMMWQQNLYQAALQLAQALARPSLPERDLLGVWN
jgi:hypothetical protein